MHNNDRLRKAAVEAHSDATNALFDLMMAHGYGDVGSVQRASALLRGAANALDAALAPASEVEGAPV